MSLNESARACASSVGTACLGRPQGSPLEFGRLRAQPALECGSGAAAFSRLGMFRSSAVMSLVKAVAALPQSRADLRSAQGMTTLTLPNALGAGRRGTLAPVWSMVAVLLVAQACAPLHAQGWNANLEGVVLDPSGAAIPGASIRLRSSGTAQTRTTQTDDSGFYNFPFLPVGTYELEASKPGFAQRIERGLVLEVGQTARQDLTLQLAREQVQVKVAEAQTPLVETTSPAVSEEFDNRRVSLLPLNGRQYSQLALLAAGAVPPYPNSATQQFNTAALGLGFSVNGQRSERNDFTLDGVTIMEPFAYSITVNPSIDAIREFRVVENSYSAAQGLISGAQVQIATRAGSNRLSGTAYEFLRNSALDAKNFFDDPNRPIPPYRQNQFGGSLGGPLRPDRTFFFSNYEGFRIRQSITNTTLLPTGAERAGDFSGVNPQTGNPFPKIIDPASGQPFQGNQVPVSRFDPLSVAELERIPLPNQPDAPPGQNNNINVGQYRLTSDQFTMRIDHQLTARHQLFGRFLYFDSAQLFPFVPTYSRRIRPPLPASAPTTTTTGGIWLWV